MIARPMLVVRLVLRVVIPQRESEALGVHRRQQAIERSCWPSRISTLAFDAMPDVMERREIHLERGANFGKEGRQVGVLEIGGLLQVAE